ncbi:MAG: CDP-diacylglycerol--glycerol-3-phosphate 3-phosphatidyltransferase [Clostridia bacterium]|nr:CDP-diacylglycerol--glycerol-3-phosphate 3-phosphatidyltransferase [Clostridia bacterium]
MNLPNKLTVLRLIMVPIFMVVMLIPVFATLDTVTEDILTLVGAFLFIAAAITDMLDGKIARRDGLVTDFGKFLDPLADKFMVIGALLCVFYSSFTKNGGVLSILYFFALVIVIFRELAVTSIRLIASSSKGVVIAANMLGKLKTVMQIVAISSAMIEPVLMRAVYTALNQGGAQFDSAAATEVFISFPPITVISTVAMIYLTIHSGVNYIVGAWKYLDHTK